MRLPLFLLALCVLQGRTLASQKPNIVIVITDDQGYGDLSCHGNPVLETPHIDALHAASIRLTDYHVSPTCSPTRAALLTGHWSNRTGVWHTIMGRSMLRKSEVTLGEVFGSAGYATGMFGKWHLGDNYPYRPEDRGFIEVLRHGGGGIGQTPDHWDNAYFDGTYSHNGIPEPVEGFCTDVFFDYAKRFIKKQEEAGKPFLALISPNAPHSPMHAPGEYAGRYREQGTHVANFFGMIANIDDNVGALRTFLEEEGIAKDTIFIFTTDNGTSAGAEIHNSGMRGMKGSEYDGGHRVPFFIRWPAGDLGGGRDVTELTAHVDILPTLIDLCDVPSPDGVEFDGRTIADLLQGKRAKPWPDRIMITDSQRVKDPIKWRKSAVMSSQWRLINGGELYDIRADPGQKRDVASANPEVVTRLTEAYDEWWTELEPFFVGESAIVLGHPAADPVALTSHDWISTGEVPWNQRHIREASPGAGDDVYWNVDIFEDGEYEVRLRRWPAEADLAIDAALAPGADVPGAKAFRSARGRAISVVRASLKIGDQKVEIDVGPGAKDAVFSMRLKAGKTRMSPQFFGSDGAKYGAYYAYVRKM